MCIARHFANSVQSPGRRALHVHTLHVHTAPCVHAAVPCHIHWINLWLEETLVHCGALLFLLELALGGVVGDTLQHLCRLAREPE